MRSFIIWLKILFNTLLYNLRYLKVKDDNLIKKWSKSILQIIGAKIIIDGIIPHGDYIIVSNHVSYLDPIVLNVVFDKHLTWIAKKELLKWPLIGMALKQYNVIFVDRGDSKKSAIVILKTIKNINNNRPLAIFPQGTRKSKEAFKNGAFLLAKKIHIPVLPVKIINTDKILKDNLLNFNNNVKIIVKIFNSIDVDKYSLEEISKIAKEKIV